MIHNSRGAPRSTVNFWRNFLNLVGGWGIADIFLREQIHLRRRGELLELVAVLLAARGLAYGTFGREFGFFKVAENHLRTFQYFLWHAGQARDMDAVTLVRAAFDDFAQ